MNWRIYRSNIAFFLSWCSNYFNVGTRARHAQHYFWKLELFSTLTGCARRAAELLVQLLLLFFVRARTHFSETSTLEYNTMPDVASLKNHFLTAS